MYAVSYHLSPSSPFCSLVHEFLELEGPTLLNMRIKHLIKVDNVDKAAVLAKICSEYPGYEGKGNFKQTFLVCICMTKSQEQLMEEVRNDTVHTKSSHLMLDNVPVTVLTSLTQQITQ